jgi:hypothetical protein
VVSGTFGLRPEGVDAVLLKPLDAAELISLTRRLLRTSASGRASTYLTPEATR